ncbi:bifunctional phosphopantothenoylcysteine decarboxylase/phosphopantothenate--cysteine ligase CoaBC [Acetomicrobium sp.]|uniref:bifunctional phosphopantothenoylcysteine decarboxylase/phosphopantothenate--cysteine ligase CoaBC n=1 Tax=Acetomicrobium sp. TaxID=1872099 RepID=UPI001BCBCF8F|nr:bifunctional phosphopantothenoylcysteine decarboxylase/phosphopantothenate--cysteine ligase CoaBC [Acetomicrobium sp.]
MLEWKTNRKILLGISGGISAYKIPDVVSTLKKYKNDIEVIMTQSASSFVTPLSLSTLTGKKTWMEEDFLSDQRGWEIPHIALADWAEVFIIAPATANVIRRAALGEAETLLGATMLATRAPVVIFPAMNIHMWEHPATQRHVKMSGELGYIVIPPEEGFLACGYEGKGRLPKKEVILEILWRVLSPKRDLIGKKIIVTAGPTREFMDPVRFISNPSSGKMGYAVARTAWYRGADVTLIKGPTYIEPPFGVKTIDVTTAQEMYDAVLKESDGADIIVKAAAVGDYRFAHTLDQKLKREGKGRLEVILEENPDIAAEVGKRKKLGQILVGFAAESTEVVENALSKLNKKNMDMIVANDITARGSGFESDTNSVTVICKTGHTSRLEGSKEEVAWGLWDIVEVELLS